VNSNHRDQTMRPENYSTGLGRREKRLPSTMICLVSTRSDARGGLKFLIKKPTRKMSVCSSEMPLRAKKLVF
jgi:hypothetical protein